MFELNYYFVDVGDNFCEVRERTADIALKDAFSDKGEARNAFARKYIRLKLKEMLISDCDVYKFVAVNKVGKLSVKSRIDNDSQLDIVEPFYSSDEMDIYIIRPKEELYIICSVKPKNLEHVAIPFDRLFDPCSPKKKSKRKTL